MPAVLSRARMVSISLAESLAGRHLVERESALLSGQPRCAPDRTTFEVGKRCEDMKDQLSGW
jgi:hypothetical protein